MRVGVLTGGGDCPGLNAVIRAVVRKGVKEYGYEFVGFRDGWKGPLEEPRIVPPRGRMPRTCLTPSSLVSPSRGPFQPSRNPTNS